MRGYAWNEFPAADDKIFRRYYITYMRRNRNGTRFFFSQRFQLFTLVNKLQFIQRTRLPENKTYYRYFSLEGMIIINTSYNIYILIGLYTNNILSVAALPSCVLVLLARYECKKHNTARAHYVCGDDIITSVLSEGVSATPSIRYR